MCVEEDDYYKKKLPETQYRSTEKWYKKFLLGISKY